MARSIHDKYTTAQPDFIPECDEHLFPATGGIFCDFIPEGANAVEMRPTYDQDGPNGSQFVETLETLPVAPGGKKRK